MEWLRARIRRAVAIVGVKLHRHMALLIVGVVAILGLGGVWRFYWWFDRHEGTAAWVQAFGAIAVIAATAWIANENFAQSRQQTREAERRLWDSIAVLSRNCLKCYDDVSKKANSLQVNKESFAWYSPSDFEAPLDGLAAIPLYQIGRVDLLAAVIELRQTMGRVKGQLDTFRDAVGRSPGYLTFDVSGLRNRRTAVFNAHANIMRIVHGSTPEIENELSRLATDP